MGTIADVAKRSEPARSANARAPLRICHLAYTFYENDNRVIRYAQAMAERGDQVDVIALRRPDQSRRGVAHGVRILRIQRRAVTEKRAITYFAKIFYFFVKSLCLFTFMQPRWRYDVVHVHNVPDFLVFAAWLPKLMGARIVLDIHDILPELYAGKFGSARRSLIFRSLLLVERLSCRFADHVIVSNDLWREKLLHRTVSDAKCSTFLNYPDLRLFKPLRECEKSTDGTFVILYPGTLNHHQGLDIAIRAFALIKERMPNSEFRIYGEGPARPELIQLVENLGLNDRVKVLDRLSLEQISRVMASASVGVVPKRADGFGNEAFSTKILEFMACGVPVVVSRTKIDAHYFDESIVRFFIPGNETNLSEVLLGVFQDYGAQESTVRAAREFAGLNSWQHRAAEYSILIDSLVLGSVAAGNGECQDALP
jgi:glycosyltransferase involved in cell wall biosynthesis